MDDISVLAFFLGAIFGVLLYFIFAPLLVRIREYRHRVHVYIAGIALISLAAVFFVRAINAGTDDILFPVNQFLTLPIAPNFALGVIFGLLAANWPSYIKNPERLKEEYVRVAHRWWGYSLLFIAAVGIFYPTINRVVENLEGVETPFGSLTIARHAEQSPIQLHGLSTGSDDAGGMPFTSTSTFFLQRLTGIGTHIKEDQEYISILEPNEAKVREIQSRHSILQAVYLEFFVPFHECIALVMAKASDPEFLHAHVSRLDHRLKSGFNKIKAFEIEEDLNSLLDFVRKTEPEENDCSTLENVLRREPPFEVNHIQLFWKSQPYGAMAAAFLIGGAGAHETAILDLTKWLDEQYKNNQFKRENGAHEWYVVRAQIYLEQMLQTLGSERARKEVLDQNITLMRNLYSKATGDHANYVRNIDHWRRNCTDIEAGSAIHSLAFSLINQIDRRISVALELGKYDEILLESARKNAELSPNCMLLVRRMNDIAVQDFVSQFDANYGEMLVRMADEEVKKFRRQTNRSKARYREAYAILGEAISGALRYQDLVEKKNISSEQTSGLYYSIINQSREIEVRIERAQSLRDHVVAQL